MIIHKTHSKKDIVDLFSQLGIVLDKKFNKINLINQVKDVMINKENIDFKNNDYNITDLSVLKIYLESENQEGKIDALEKDIVMDKAKCIVHWSKCKYNMEASSYESIEQIFNDCIYISKYGFIPSVRRACRLHNECVYKIDHVNPSLPIKTQRKISEAKKRTRTTGYNIKISHGKFILRFD
tara:strand:+ start:8916 stop:9461 length:546 start_codon:yes stop_codon:yes gene_type:complete